MHEENSADVQRDDSLSSDTEEEASLYHEDTPNRMKYTAQRQAASDDAYAAYDGAEAVSGCNTSRKIRDMGKKLCTVIRGGKGCSVNIFHL